MKKTTILMLVIIITIGALQRIQAQFPAIGQVAAKEFISIAVRNNPYDFKIAPDSIPENIITLLNECNTFDADNAYLEYKKKANIINEKESLFWDFFYYILAEEIIRTGSCMEKNIQSQIDKRDSALYYDYLPASDTNNTVMEATVDTAIKTALERSNNQIRLIIQKLNIENETQLLFLLNILGFDLLESEPIVNMISNAAKTSAENKGLWHAIMSVYYSKQADTKNACKSKVAAKNAGYTGPEIDLNDIECK
jgi:hypothetical protein